MNEKPQLNEKLRKFKKLSAAGLKLVTPSPCKRTNPSSTSVTKRKRTRNARNTSAKDTIETFGRTSFD